ncbi:hypothetical protein O1D97_12255 [Marinomonas sp. 15G1-11]|jgi:hypothetical protein|uniref:DUF2384 domain-containing protein n=1 Tax=Marinomonas phaeophyticola TaxID=3004091 RepID=A0ABT4JVK3_9GAMM|nr:MULTISPECIES: hypothetical protein [Marinomonas]MCZ2722374.1 hypothetical protein [Marinomonas sp. 15G1-11]
MNDEGIKENASNLPADKIIAAVVLWLDEQCPQERWDLSDEQMCVLLGGITVSTWKQWKEIAQTNDSLQVDQETIDTLAMLVSIYKMIHLSSPPGFKYDFFKRSINHPTFNGKSAREFMLENPSLDDFLKVRNHFRSKVLI